MCICRDVCAGIQDSLMPHSRGERLPHLHTYYVVLRNQLLSTAIGPKKAVCVHCRYVCACKQGSFVPQSRE